MYRSNFARLSLISARWSQAMAEFIPWFPTGTPHGERVVHVRELAARTGVAIVGCLYCIGGRSEDESRGFHNLELGEQDFLDILRRRIRQDKDYGCEYGTFQLHLPPEHLGTGGLYRGDEEFLELTAQRIADIQAVCFAEGLNCYFETHIDKVSEDLQAFAGIIHRAPHFEVTGDLSHCPGRRGRLSAISVFLYNSVLYGAFVWAQGA
jgi:hypothetical protein